MKNTKKAAMFGLDARIALVIFGALSIISGAALFSAIQKAQTEQWHQYFERIVKATEQYYLDNGKQLSEYEFGTDRGSLYAGDLVTNRKKLLTWEGPYLSNIQRYGLLYFKDNMTVKYNKFGSTVIRLRKTSTWTKINEENTDDLCVLNSSNCSEWVALTTGILDESKKIFNQLDALVDGSDGGLTGRVRYNIYDNGNRIWVMYQSIPHKRRLS